MVETLVRKLSRYVELSREEEETIRSLPSHVQDYGKGENLVREGTSPTESALLMVGMAFRYRDLANGTRQIMALHIPGDFVDLHSFVLQPMDHSVAALVPARVARVPHERLAWVLGRHPRLARALMWDLALDAATYREWMVGLGRRDAYERIAHLLCELYYRMRMVGLLRGQGFKLPLSQPELGDAMGLSAVHVNRSLQALRSDGLVVTEKLRVTIPDIKKLSAAAGFDPAYLRLISKPGD
jgi:CRP-like cAMP-binding protein